MSDWREDYEVNGSGVDPSDYEYADDFFDSLRNSERRANEKKNGGGGNEGCYIATCVYGSYDCPEVWTLRRFRDFRLAESAPGRAFIKTYYFLSPKAVRCFGSTRWFQGLGRFFLDAFVKRLKRKGYSDKPYRD